MTGYLIVEQFTQQQHAYPKEYITTLPMNNGLYPSDYGDYSYKVYLEENQVQKVVASINKENPYRKVNYIEVDIL